MSVTKLKLAFFSKGRSHLWDLFMNMQDFEVDSAFYTDVPLFRLRQFGLARQSVKSFFTNCFPYFALSQLKLKSLNDTLDRLWIEKLDSVTSQQLQPCDLFIGLSGISLKSLKIAKSKYGARVWLERGSVHILEQKKIIESIQGAQSKLTVPSWAVERELEGYELADRIVVPSTHVAETFYERGFRKDQILINGYGVNLLDFPITPKPENKIPTAIFVGGWTYQKGCDILGQLVLSDESFQLIHVGSPGDCPFPVSPNFKSVGHVFQRDLHLFYAKADILILASRQDGFGLVLSQALASGLPIVCSPKCGGKDLLSRIGPTPAIKVLTDLHLETLKKAINEQFTFASTQNGLRDLMGEKRELLSWSGCTQQYFSKIELDLGINKKVPKKQAVQK